MEVLQAADGTTFRIRDGSDTARTLAAARRSRPSSQASGGPATAMTEKGTAAVEGQSAGQSTPPSPPVLPTPAEVIAQAAAGRATLPAHCGPSEA
jgi:hypothetical protein